jgi:hypothetical protein
VKLRRHVSRAVAVAATAALLIGATVNGGELDGDLCGRAHAASPSLRFDLESGPAARKHIPGLGSSPELDVAQGPFTVVVFEGPHHAVPLFPPLQQADNTRGPTVLDRVMCVVTSDGVENYYFDVDLSGVDVAELAVDRREP